MLGDWSMQGGQTNQGELFIAMTHEDYKPIIFDRVLKAGNSVLLPAKMVIKNTEEVNAVNVKSKKIKRMLPQSDRTYWTSFNGCHSKILQG